MAVKTAIRTHPEYARKRERAGARESVLSRLGRDIGDIPPVADSDRKARAATSFRAFCEAYFPNRFHLAWSADHLKIIAKIEQAVLRGGLFAMAMPRGSGKTSLCEVAVLFALLFDHHKFVLLLGASEEHAARMLANLKTELTQNDRLAADFPEVVYPIRCLEGQTRRCVGQLHHGQPTLIGWTADEIVLPTIPGSRASGSLVRIAGITGAIRGAVHALPSGRTIRPTLVILDDPQTDQSARSPTQCAEREAVINGAVLNVAGPGKTIAAVMPCTVIRPDDMADRLLDRERYPQWQGERTKMVYAWPTAEKEWDEYARIRADGLRNETGTAAATEFYRQRREAMDAGAVVAWPERKREDELSAVQHAMNLRLTVGAAAFDAEYQNEPSRPEDSLAGFCPAPPGDIARRFNGLPRGCVPIRHGTLTAHIDCHGAQSVLFWLVAAWREDFTGAVIDYGAWPDQGRAYWTAREARRTLADATGAQTPEGAILTGLEQLTAWLLPREFQREDGAPLRIGSCLTDRGYKAETVDAFCRRSPHAAILLPSRGEGLTAKNRPMEEYTRRRGERLGNHWYLTLAKTRANRYVMIDTNYWKTFIHERLKVTPGDAGALTLFGREGVDDHRMLADHLSAESCVQVEARGRTVLEWQQKPAKPDNHWFDCLVGAAAAASMGGCKLGSFEPDAPKRRVVSFSAMQRERMAAA